MGRLKGIINSNSSSIPDTLTFTPKERIQFLANLIIDRIIEDQHGEVLALKKVPPK